jgi:hypothetical protein
MAQYERELTVLENVDKINEASSIADQIVYFDVARSPRIQLEIGSKHSTGQDGDHIEIGVIDGCPNRVCLVVAADQGATRSHDISRRKRRCEAPERFSCVGIPVLSALNELQQMLRQSQS